VKVDGINKSCSMPDKLENAYKASVVKPVGNSRPFGNLRRRLEANVRNRL
jgi:hypothetical protein